MRDLTEFRWWDDDHKDKRFEVLTGVVRFLYERDEPRRMRIERSVRLFGPGIQLGNWKPPENNAGMLALNLVRTLTHTAASNVIDKPPPRPFFVTDGGDYQLQERAEGMSKLASGAIYQADFDGLAEGGSMLTCLTGKTFFKILEYRGRPSIESVNPWQVLVDERDAAEGKPQCLYQISWVDRDVLKARHKDQADDIDDARKGGIDDPWGEDGLSDQVLVMEAWRLPSGEDTGDGRYVCCTDNCTLVDEEWEDETFPFASLDWQKPVGCFWPAGIGDEVWPTQYELNLVVERMRQMLHKIAVPRIYLMNGTKVTPGPINNQIGASFNVQGQAPIFDIAKAISPEYERWLDYWWVKGFQQLGISEQAAMAMKPAGLDSGKAQLVHADLTSGRLSGWGRRWQACYTEVSRQVVRCLRRIAKKKPGLEVTYLDPQGQSLERIRWAEVSLDEDAYLLQCFPISSLASTPQGRIAQLDAWKKDGTIDLPTYRRLLNMPDLKSQMDLLNGPRDLLEKILTDMLYGSGRYVAPEPYDDLDLARQVASFHLLRARSKGAPGKRLALARDFIVEVDRLQAAKAPPPLPPAPPGAPPPLPAAA